MGVVLPETLLHLQYGVILPTSPHRHIVHLDRPLCRVGHIEGTSSARVAVLRTTVQLYRTVRLYGTAGRYTGMVQLTVFILFGPYLGNILLCIFKDSCSPRAAARALATSSGDAWSGPARGRLALKRHRQPYPGGRNPS